MAAHPDGTLLKASGPEIDMMAGGVRRWVPDPTTFNYMGLDWGKVVTVPDAEWAATPTGPPFPSRVDGTLLQGSGPKVYVVQNGQRHWVPDPTTFNASGYKWSAIVHVSDADLTAIPEGIAVATNALAAVNTSSAQLESLLSQIGSQPVSAADLLALQSSLAQFTTQTAAASAIIKEVSDTLKSVAQKIG